MDRLTITFVGTIEYRSFNDFKSREGNGYFLSYNFLEIFVYFSQLSNPEGIPIILSDS